jgi:orotate phosphoribosyltransferase
MSLRRLMRETGGLKFGEFTLASGQKSNYYLDCKRLLLHPEGLERVTDEIVQLLLKHYRHAPNVGGPEVGVVPLVGSVLSRLQHYNRLVGDSIPWRGFILRKKAKTHGTGSLIEGLEPQAFAGRSRCVVLEDVVSTGGSVLATRPALEAQGYKIDTVVAVIDRQQGGREAFREHGIHFIALTTADELLKGSTTLTL